MIKYVFHTYRLYTKIVHFFVLSNFFIEKFEIIISIFSNNLQIIYERGRPLRSTYKNKMLYGYILTDVNPIIR